VSRRSFSFAFLTPAVRSIGIPKEKTVLVSVVSRSGTVSTSSGGGGSHNNGVTFEYTLLLAAPRLMSVVPSNIPTTQPPNTRVKFSGRFFSAQGVSAAICGKDVILDCDYSPSQQFIVCDFTMPTCNVLGNGILRVDADDLDAPLEIAVKFVVPPLQVLLTSLQDDTPTISHTTYRKVDSTSPTTIVLYAWSVELDFPQVGLINRMLRFCDVFWSPPCLSVCLCLSFLFSSPCNESNHGFSCFSY
jgi:hypothetical protein